jgi:two-component system, cell cycle response regulator DivK
VARILIVEDNAANMELLRYLLHRAGHSVACARDGVEGVELLRGESPQLVLCDLRMPRLDGFGFLVELRRDRRHDDVVIVAVSAYSMPGDSQRAMAAGFDGYVTKPLDPMTIVATVEACLAAGTRKP